MQNISLLDAKNMLGSIAMFGEQINHSWQDMKKIKLPRNYEKVNKIVLCGMGGSLLGMDVVKNLFFDQIKVPIEIVNRYDTPAYIDSKTLVILSSYSGSTEEVVSASQKILKKTKNIFIVTTGSTLATLAQQKKIPAYIIDPVYNPCQQPRIAVGYTITAVLALLKKIKVIKISDQQIQETILYLKKNQTKLEIMAFKQAIFLKKYIPVLVASEFLLGNAHVATNQINENGKNMAMYFAIPELNHHLMEGLANPKQNKNNLYFVLINSHLYYVRNRTRYEVTKKVLTQNKIKFLEFKPMAGNKLLQSFEVLQWGGYLSFYLAINNNIDPSPIPYVDYFKHELKK
ncbi:MAG: SIS domain-containing protein [Patescibacteria group bacterium]